MSKPNSSELANFLIKRPPTFLAVRRDTLISERMLASLLLAAIPCALAASDDFYISTAAFNTTFPSGLETQLMYSPDGLVGLFPYCTKCFKFNGSITDDGFYEITSSEEGWLENPYYLNVDEETGQFIVNETAQAATWTISGHMLYYNGSSTFKYLEADYNHTYYIYSEVADDDIEELGTVYQGSLVPRLKGGTYYLYYAASDATTSHSLSVTLDQIPTSQTGLTTTDDDDDSTETSDSDSDSTSTASSSSSSSSSAAAATVQVASITIMAGLASILCYFL